MSNKCVYNGAYIGKYGCAKIKMHKQTFPVQRKIKSLIALVVRLSLSAMWDGKTVLNEDLELFPSSRKHAYIILTPLKPTFK